MISEFLILISDKLIILDGFKKWDIFEWRYLEPKRGCAHPLQKLQVPLLWKLLLDGAPNAAKNTDQTLPTASKQYCSNDEKTTARKITNKPCYLIQFIFGEIFILILLIFPFRFLIFHFFQDRRRTNSLPSILFLFASKLRNFIPLVHDLNKSNFQLYILIKLR